MALNIILLSVTRVIFKITCLLLFIQTAIAQEIRFTKVDHDFGDVMQGEKLTHDFVVENSGTGDLVIRKISASCGCTAGIAESAILKPGDQTKIKVSFNTAGFIGEKLKTVRAYSNDAANSSQVLMVRANVLPEITTDPDRIDLNEIVVGQGAKVQVSLRRHAGVEVGVKEVFSKNEFITASYVKQTDKIKLEIDPKTPIGKVRSRFTIKSDSERSPVINVPVNFEVVGNLKIEPDSLNFGRVLKSAGRLSKTFKVISRDRTKEFEIEYVKSDNKRVRVSELPKDSTGAIAVQVDLFPESVEVIRGLITLKARGEESEYKISFFGYVDER